MKVFLLWKYAGGVRSGLAARQVAADLHRIFAPLFGELPPARLRRQPSAHLAFLELPVSGWKPALFEEDDQGWAFASDFPVNGKSALADIGAAGDRDRILLRLCRAIQVDPVPVLHRLAPPTSLVWSNDRMGDTFVQNDGLGHAQLFEYRGDRMWALTNKISALPALGIPLRPIAREWASRFTLGWFPGEMTGYRGVRYLAPGTQLHITPEGIDRKRHDILSSWVAPRGLSRAECLELAHDSLIDFLREAQALWERPRVGLSGGWDSRAVVAGLRASGAEFSLRVRGQDERPDTVIAKQLAERVGMDLKVRRAGGLPSEHAAGCRRSIQRALVWQAGHAVTHKHVAFLARKAHLRGGGVNIMGSTGEICRAYYAKKFALRNLDANGQEAGFLDGMMRRMPPFIRREHHDYIRDSIRGAYLRADKHGLEKSRRLDFFYLFERVRRWRAGSMNAQTGQVIAPFLNPGLIAATFSYPGRELAENPFHRFIIERGAPEWIGVPFADELASTPGTHAGIEPTVGRDRSAKGPALWRLPVGNETYDRSLHWREVGRPLIRAAMKEGGFWTEIFDPGESAKQWAAAPDALVIAWLLPDLHIVPGVLPREADRSGL